MNYNYPKDKNEDQSTNPCSVERLFCQRIKMDYGISASGRYIWSNRRLLFGDKVASLYKKSIYIRILFINGLIRIVGGCGTIIDKTTATGLFVIFARIFVFIAA